MELVHVKLLVLDIYINKSFTIKVCGVLNYRERKQLKCDTLIILSDSKSGIGCNKANMPL